MIDILRDKRYLQIAFNSDLFQAYSVLSRIPRSDRIFIEAGTPFIKKEGMAGVRRLSSLWRGIVVADLKISDGALGEVRMARSAGAKAATALGSAPDETLNLFVEECAKLRMISMIDMLGIDEPLNRLRKLKKRPDVVVLHRGRDEEGIQGKGIPYRQVNKIRSKFDSLISAAGGVDFKEARSAIFNGADIVVVNIVSNVDPWTGIDIGSDIHKVVQQFLDAID